MLSCPVFVKKTLPHSVQSRFDQETTLWNSYHQDGEPTLVHREIVLRKQLTKKLLLERYQGQSIRILEVGCGTGENLKEIIDLDPAWRGVGVDISPNMIKECQAKFSQNERLSFAVLDIEEGILEDTFDAVVLLGVVGYFNKTQQAFNHVCAMLKPGGVGMFTYGNKQSMFRMIRWVASRWSFFWPTYQLGSVVRRLLGKRSVAYKKERSFFFSRTPAFIRSCVQSCNAKVVKEYGLLYASGVFGRVSVWGSRMVELFMKRDWFNQAFTKFMVIEK